MGLIPVATANIDSPVVELCHHVSSDTSFGLQVRHRTHYLPFTCVFHPDNPSTEARWVERKVTCPHCARSFLVRVLEWPALLVAPSDYPSLLRYADAKTLNWTIASFFMGFVFSAFVAALFQNKLLSLVPPGSELALLGSLTLAGAALTALSTFIGYRLRSRIAIRRRVPLLFLPLRSKRWKHVHREFKDSKLARTVIEIAADEGLDKVHFMSTDGGASPVYVYGWDNFRRRATFNQFAIFGIDEPPTNLGMHSSYGRADPAISK